MLGNLMRALVGFLANHLVALTLMGFAIVGAALIDLITVPGISPGATAGDAMDQQQRSEPAATQAVPEPSQSSDVEGALPTQSNTQPSPRAPAQPSMIGGTLPNYAAAESAFRPPVSEAPPPHAPFRQDREQWVQRARQAFWNGDFEAAETAYMDAITAFPEDADLFGELGNLYQSMGEDALALEAYFEAGLRLRAAGNLEKLSLIIDLLDSYGYPDAASLGP